MLQTVPKVVSKRDSVVAGAEFKLWLDEGGKAMASLLLPIGISNPRSLGYEKMKGSA